MPDPEVLPEAVTRWLRERVPGLVDPDGATEQALGETAKRADRPEHHGDLDGAVAAVARALRVIHDLDPGDAPLRRGWAELERDIELRGDHDTSVLPDPYGRYPAADLRSIWVGGRPSSEDLVVCHGRPTLDQFWVDTRPTPTGLVEVCAVRDAGRFRIADRHLDLAVVQQSLLVVYGFEAVVLFYEHYGIDPDLLRLDHYVLAGLLLDGPVERA